MPRKFVGYFLLSLLSFCFFTGVFNTIANAQTTQPMLQPETADNAIPLPPTPTVYNYAPSISQQPIKAQNSTIIPTPTLFMGSANTPASPTQQVTSQPTATPTPQPTATPTPTEVPTATPTPQPTITTSADLETLFSKYSTTYNVDENELK